MPQTVLQVLIKHKDEKLITEENYIHSMQRQLFNQMLAERLGVLAQTPDLPYISAEAGISGLEGGLDDFTLGRFSQTGNRIQRRISDGLGVH